MLAVGAQRTFVPLRGGPRDEVPIALAEVTFGYMPLSY